MIIDNIDEIDVLELYAGKEIYSIGDDGIMEIFTDTECIELEEQLN